MKLCTGVQVNLRAAWTPAAGWKQRLEAHRPSVAVPGCRVRSDTSVWCAFGAQGCLDPGCRVE
eukprot:9424736-Alexandrium_andersonii.AAC.1